MSDASNDTRRQATEASRAYLTEMSEVNRKLFSAWASGAEASLKATLEVQQAALSAGISLLSTGGSENQAAGQHWADVARQAQQAALEAFQATLRAAEQAMTPPKAAKDT
jgi:nicotinamide mononucleotide (NMN) deamidase PncC